jgi:hypothetical protein
MTGDDGRFFAVFAADVFAYAMSFLVSVAEVADFYLLAVADSADFLILHRGQVGWWSEDVA